MAKDHPPSKSKVRVFYAEVEGGDETIKDGIQSLAVALARAMQPPPPPRPKIALAAPTTAKAEEPNLFNLHDHGPESDQIEEGEHEEAESLEDEPAPRAKVARHRKARTYTVVPDLNLRPDGQPSLVDFHRDKGPTDQQEQVAVFLYYLSRTLKLADVTDRHLYTCFKEVGAKVPPEILQVMRNTARRKGWVDASGTDNLRLTVHGENFVEHSLPKTKPIGK